MSATGLRFGRAPGAWPLLGHVVALQRRPLALLDSLPAHGDLVQIRLGPRPAYVVCHPGLARQVLTDLRGFDRTGLAYERLRTAMGNGLGSAAHQDHRRQRLIMQPAFRREHLRGYVSVMRQEITAAMESWRDGDSVDLVDEMFTLTTTIALRALFSSQLDPDRAELLRRAFDIFLRGIYTRAVLPLAGRLPTPGNRRYRRAVAAWRTQVSELIDAYRRSGADRGGLMSRLLAARDDEDHGTPGLLSPLRRRRHPLHRRGLRPSRSHPHPRHHGRPLDPVIGSRHSCLPGRPSRPGPPGVPGSPVSPLTSHVTCGTATSGGDNRRVVTWVWLLE
ncbi:MAG TPA: cytochrome P450 [Streptosporangiaceae bacterium]|nr:cytochrome P450 [Streptosporangiaceae bacterium]